MSKVIAGVFLAVSLIPGSLSPSTYQLNDGERRDHERIVSFGVRSGATLDQASVVANSVLRATRFYSGDDIRIRLASIAWVESQFNPRTNWYGACGCWQIIPSTASYFDKTGLSEIKRRLEQDQRYGAGIALLYLIDLRRTRNWSNTLIQYSGGMHRYPAKVFRVTGMMQKIHKGRDPKWS